LDRERIYQLGPDSIVWRDRGETKKISYRDFNNIRVIKYPSFGGDHSQCTLHSGSNGKIVLRSHAYIRLGSFDDRTDSYLPFVRSLLRRIHAANPAASFVAGNTGLWVMWIILLASALGIMLLVILDLIGGASSTKGVIGAVVALLIFIPGAWRIARRGKGTPFDPEDPAVL
jgi:hypothetical protein